MNLSIPQCDSHLLQEMLSGVLPTDRVRELDDHLESCSACRWRLDNDNDSQTIWSEIRGLLKDGLAEVSPSRGPLRPSDAMPLSSQIDLVLKALSPSDAPESLGTIGGYEITEVIGAGGMGVVLKGNDPTLDRPIAIKVLSPNLASSGAARARFLREARAVASVIHPNVVSIFSVSIERELPFLVMPFIHGTSLQKRLDQGRDFPYGDILRLGIQIAAGLAASHERGVIHRDIKPSNIIVAEENHHVTITDFGLALTMDETSLTGSNLIVGTPAYMSPEQVQCQSIDARSDLFSFGLVLYALCTGTSPFQADSTYGSMKRIVEESPVPIRQRNPSIPDWLDVLILKMMKKEVDRRPENAREVEALLRACLAHVEEPARFSLPIQLTTSHTSTKHFFNRRMIVLTFLSLLGIVPLAGWITFSDPQDPNATRVAKGRTVVEGQEIRLLGYGSVQGLEMVTQFDLSGLKVQSSVQQFSQNGNGGSVAGGAGGASGGSSGSYNKPNFGVALAIAAETKTKKKGNPSSDIVELSPQFAIVDSDGKETKSPDYGPARNTFPKFEQTYPGSKGLYLYRPSTEKSPLLQVRGELLVTPGRRLEVHFAGTQPKVEKFGNDSIELLSVKDSKDGFTVEVKFPATNAAKNAKSPQDRFAAMVNGRSAHKITVEDTQGKIYTPVGGSNGGSSFESSFTTQNGRGFQRGQGSMGTSQTPTIQFNFPPLQSDAKFKSIHVVFTDREGESKSIPFTIDVQEESK